MQKLWPVLLLAIAPVVHLAACGSDSDSPGASDGPAGGVGGQIQDFDWAIQVKWTVRGQDPSTECDAVVAGGVELTLSGTEDIGLHQTKDVDCAAGTYTFKGLTRVATGSAPFIDGVLTNSDGVTLWRASGTVTAASGTQTIALDFADVPIMSTSSTTVSTTGGMGGMGGSGGSGNGGGGAGQGGSGGSPATSSSATHAASSSASTGAGGGSGGAGGG